MYWNKNLYLLGEFDLRDAVCYRSHGVTSREHVTLTTLESCCTCAFGSHTLALWRNPMLWLWRMHVHVLHEPVNQRRFKKWKDGELYAYPVQNKWAACGPQCVYAPFLLSTWDAYLTSICGRSQCCLFCFFVNSQSHPYKSMNKPNLSWSRARRVISYRHVLIGEVIRVLHCPIAR